MRYLVLDLETTGTKTYKRFCNPLDPTHSITLVATKPQGQAAHSRYCVDGIPREAALDHIDLTEFDMIVGQNIKFDLLWLWGSPQLQQWLRNGGRVWDTCTVEYLLTGQLGREYVKYDLNTLAKKYGGEVKDDRIGEMFKNGMKANEIPADLLIPYALGDVINTQKVLLGQFAIAKKRQVLPLIKVYMEHYLALCEMEYNGMHVDVTNLLEKQQGIIKEIEQIVETTKTLTKNPEFNPGSNQQVSIFLFNKVQSVSEAALLKVVQSKTANTGFAELILQYRGLKKLSTTYILSETYYLRDNNVKGIKKGDSRCKTGLIPLVQPWTRCVHTEYNPALTRTGRLSSQNPNLQNLPPEILDVFKSRYGKEGSIIEFDYSQLEVIVQAFLTQSDRMIKDIHNKIDFHCLRLSYAEGKPYDQVVKLCQDDVVWKLKRKHAKTISFQKAYGAAPKKIAESTKLPIEIVERVFALEDEAYPEIKTFYNDVLEAVQGTRKPLKSLLKIRNKTNQTIETKDGEQAALGQYQSILGKRYTFSERAVFTSRGIFRFWSMPDIQNYPVQGTAADIVAMQVGRVYRYMNNLRDKGLMINEIHDSLILDVKNEFKSLIIEDVYAILKDVKGGFEQYFNLKFNVSIEVDYKEGANWGEIKQ